MALLQKHAVRPELKHVPTEQIARAHQASENAIAEFRKGVGDWPLPLHFSLKLSEYRTLSERFDGTLTEVRRYINSMGVIQSAAKQDNAAVKQTITDERDRVLGFFRSRPGKLPSGPLTKLCADYIVELEACREEEVVAKRGPGDLSVDGWQHQPQLFMCHGDQQEGEPLFTTSMRYYFENNRDVMVAAAQPEISQAIQAGTCFRYASFSLAQDFRWAEPNVTDSPLLLNAAAEDLNAVILVMKTLKMDIRLSSYPIQRQRMLLTQVLGSTAFILLSSAQVLQNQDLIQWTENSHHSVFAKNRVVVLLPGDSLYVAPGWVAVPFPLSYDDASGKHTLPRKGQKGKDHIVQEQCCATAAHLVMDAVADAALSKDVISGILSTWLQALSRIPGTIRKHLRVIDWKAALESQLETAAEEAKVVAPEDAPTS